MIKKKNKSGFTLIEMLIVIAILVIAFEGVFHITILVYNESTGGRKELAARQMNVMTSQIIFKDVKNASGTADSYKDYTSSEDTLILIYSENSKEQPSAVMYSSENGNLYRTVFFDSEKQPVKTMIQEKTASVKFKKNGKKISWEIESTTEFRNAKKSYRCESSASLNGGF